MRILRAGLEKETRKHLEAESLQMQQVRLERGDAAGREDCSADCS